MVVLLAGEPVVDKTHAKGCRERLEAAVETDPSATARLKVARIWRTERILREHDEQHKAAVGDPLLSENGDRNGSG